MDFFEIDGMAICMRTEEPFLDVAVGRSVIRMSHSKVGENIKHSCSKEV